ncbi:hypothetical protein EK21DRAFT_93314 [Setomelanomma holmii]|uniref:Uncharacterized protein n=1 Tax=Setomelanomma holmii TaxID=210430 RepID=A0A9P4H121_9PLEO|nr:hypothetical protein EK21DRAFT_93314 [Setomelanomma holmii]
MRVITERPHDSLFLEPLFQHTAFEQRNPPARDEAAHKCSRRQSFDGSLTLAFGHTERSGILQAEPHKLDRSRTVRARASAGKKQKADATDSDNALHDGRQAVSCMSKRSFLPNFWRIPSGVHYYKSTPDALKNHDQRSFERMVTVKYLVEDTKGFRWAASARYVLFKCREDALVYRASTQVSISDRPPSSHSLSAQLNLKPMEDIAEVSRVTGQPLPALLDSGRLCDRRAVTRNCTIRKESPARYPWDQCPPDPHRVALFPPWKLPQNGRYKEDHLWFQHMSRSEIEDAVTAGYLVADSIGLRIGDSNKYKLLYLGEVDQDEPLDSASSEHPPKLESSTQEKSVNLTDSPSRCTGDEVSQTCRRCKRVHTLREKWEQPEDIPQLSPQIQRVTTQYLSSPSTPIVEKSYFVPERPKVRRKQLSLLEQGLGRCSPRYTPYVKINASKIGLDETGKEMKERVVDNEGKSSTIRERDQRHMRQKKQDHEDWLMRRKYMAVFTPFRHPHAAKG